MSDSASTAIPPPSFEIPRSFEGATLSTLAEAIAAGCPEGWPPMLVLDFQRLNFIQPAGVIFLSNLIWWLAEHGTTVKLINANRDVEALRYLDDSQFFEQHCGAKVWERSSPRSTTIPLLRIAPSHSHDWLEHTLLPWLSRNLGLTQASFYDLKTCLSELFNNIKEHTRLEIGSIFVQHYPRQDRINISLADLAWVFQRRSERFARTFRTQMPLFWLCRRDSPQNPSPGMPALAWIYCLKRSSEPIPER
jgi:hypothetical protein